MSQKAFRKQLFWRVTGRRMLRGAAAVHYTTTAERDSVEQTLNLNHGQVVPLGIEFESIPSTSQSSELTDRFQGLNDNPYVLVLSRLHPKKAIEVLIEAFDKVTSNSQFAKWRLVIAGEGSADYVAALKRLVADKRTEGRIIFAGWLNGVAKQTVLRNASLLALASYQENFGLCVMEALSCSVPVLVSPQVNLAAEITNAGAGWVSNVECSALETTLRETFANESERAKRGRAGKVLSQQFTWDRVAHQLIQLYSSITISRIK
jgi:glycosyltransferase involved in cell wall biosynthesis